MPFSDPLHPLWKVEDLRRAIHSAGVALWSWDVASDRCTMDEQAFSLWELEATGEVKFEDLSAHIHPADRDRVRAAFTATRGIVGPYEIDFRIMIGNDIRWIVARGIGDNTALHDGQMFGIFLDVTGRKQAEEGHELLAGEMSHRVKKSLAIAAGLTNITSIDEHRKGNGQRVEGVAGSTRSCPRSRPSLAGRTRPGGLVRRSAFGTSRLL